MSHDVLSHADGTMVELVTVWEVATNSDLTEGRGHNVHLGFFSSRAQAEERAAGQGVMGGPAYVFERKAVRFVDGGIIPLDRCVAAPARLYRTSQEHERETALAKLTKREQRVLGLEEP